jgi:hypothetical protein
MLGISNRLPNLVYVFMDSVYLGDQPNTLEQFLFGLVHIKKKKLGKYNIKALA